MSRRQVFFRAVVLWAIGVVGVVVLSVTTLPAILADQLLPLPLPIILAASILQSSFLVAGAIALGTALGPKVGFRSLLVHTGTPLREMSGKMLGFAGLGGMIGAGLLVGAIQTAPSDIVALQQQAPQVPVLARLLYGGITEEILIRFGMMSVITWIIGLGIQSLGGRRRAISVVAGILVSSLLFGAGHLPALVAFGGKLTVLTTAYVLFWNGLFGIMAGILFWQFNLEAAILAHMVAHVLAAVIHGGISAV